METTTELLGLGIDAKSLEAYQVCLRAVVVFFSALVMVRISHRRFLAKISAFDVGT